MEKNPNVLILNNYEVLKAFKVFFFKFYSTKSLMNSIYHLKALNPPNTEFLVFLERKRFSYAQNES